MNDTKQIKVWDLAIRVFHWTLVVSFITSYLTGEEESLIHIYSGYLVMALVVFRVIYGFVGSQYARFSDFVRGPSTVLAYAKSMKDGKVNHVVGHNPLGGWMVMALLFCLLVTTATGLKVYGLEGHGPLASNDTSLFMSTAYASSPEKEYGELDEHEEEEEWWEEIHEFFANFTVFLIVLHITGVIVSSRIEKQNLVRAMITGYKQNDTN